MLLNILIRVLDVVQVILWGMLVLVVVGMFVSRDADGTWVLRPGPLDDAAR